MQPTVRGHHKSGTCFTKLCSSSSLQWGGTTNQVVELICNTRVGGLSRMIWRWHNGVHSLYCADTYGLGMCGGQLDWCIWCIWTRNEWWWQVVLLWTLPNYLLQMVGAALLVVSTIQRRRWWECKSSKNECRCQHNVFYRCMSNRYEWWLHHGTFLRGGAEVACVERAPPGVEPAALQWRQWVVWVGMGGDANIVFIYVLQVQKH